MEDHRIRQMVLRRETHAMETLLELHGNTIKSVVYRYLGSLVEVREECIGDVLWSIWEHMEQFDPERSTLRSWIAAICRYRAIDYRRQHLRRLQTLSLEECTDRGIGIAAPEPEAFSAETEALLDILPPEDRTLLIALYADGESASALAQKQGISESGIYKRATRAKERIRKQYPERVIPSGTPRPKKG